MARPRFANLDLDTRHRILETAAEEFAARGFEGVSLNQLIDRLGMSKGSFYYYFDDKADLFTTVADLAWAIVLPVEQLDLETFNAENYWSSLEALMQEARSRVRANPCIVGREVQRSQTMAGRADPSRAGAGHRARRSPGRAPPGTAGGG